MLKRNNALKVLKDKGFVTALLRDGSRTRKLPIEQYFQRFKQSALFEFTALNSDLKGTKGVAIIKPVGGIIKKSAALLFPENVLNLDEVANNLVMEFKNDTEKRLKFKDKPRWYYAIFFIIWCIISGILILLVLMVSTGCLDTNVGYRKDCYITCMKQYTFDNDYKKLKTCKEVCDYIWDKP